MKEVNIHHSCSETNCTADEQITDAIICPWLEEYRWRHSAIIERWKLCGFFEDEDFLDINCHWLQFEPVPLINHLLLICLFIFILLAGCLCNFIVIYILARYKMSITSLKYWWLYLGYNISLCSYSWMDIGCWPLHVDYYVALMLSFYSMNLSKASY